MDELEREKPNTTHTKHNLNPRNDIKDKSHDKSDYQGSAGACDWQPKDEEQTHMPHAARDHYEEGQPPNADAKSSLENLVSEDLQTGQDNQLTKRQPRAANEEGQSQTTPSSSKALKRSSNLEPISGDTNVASQSPPKRMYADVASQLKCRKMARTSNETRGHATTCYNYPMEKWVSTFSIYMDHCAYSGRHVNATTQEVEH